MLRASLKKIKSAPNISPAKLLAVVMAVFVIVVGGWYVWAGYRFKDADDGKIDWLTLRNSSYFLSTASSAEEQQKGLGGLTGMHASRGMIFPYDKEAERCFWMKDMRFPIDIIWVDANKKVSHIEQNLQPDTYPQSYCAPGQYVIELNAGEAHKNGLKTGSPLNF